MDINVRRASRVLNMQHSQCHSLGLALFHTLYGLGERWAGVVIFCLFSINITVDVHSLPQHAEMEEENAQ